ncbi:MAG: DPP IV N-terminal domain-containing protein, partial [Planctomycetaceae bacterium]
MPTRTCIWLVACAWSLSCGGAAFAAERPALTLESIFSGTAFANKSIDNVQWSEDGASFSFTAPGRDPALLDILEYDGASGRTRLLLAGTALTVDGAPVGLSGYEWTKDRRYLLVSGPVTRTWDNVFEGPWFVHETGEEALRPLADGKPLRNVHLSPDGRRVGYVLENDLYITELESGATRAVTSDGSPNVFNGIFDYGSTEFGFTDAWHWSPDGSRIAFWRLDVTDVKVFHIVDELGKYNKVYDLKYPNTGERHAVNRIGVYELRSGRTAW